MMLICANIALQERVWDNEKWMSVEGKNKLNAMDIFSSEDDAIKWLILELSSVEFCEPFDNSWSYGRLRPEREPSRIFRFEISSLHPINVYRWVVYNKISLSQFVKMINEKLQFHGRNLITLKYRSVDSCVEIEHDNLSMFDGVLDDRIIEDPLPLSKLLKDEDDENEDEDDEDEYDRGTCCHVSSKEFIFKSEISEIIEEKIRIEVFDLSLFSKPTPEFEERIENLKLKMRKNAENVLRIKNIAY